MVKYALAENRLGTDTKGCIAVVKGQGTINLDDIIDYMIAEGTGLTRPQAMAYFEKLVQSVEYFIKLLQHLYGSPYAKIIEERSETIPGMFFEKMTKS